MVTSIVQRRAPLTAPVRTTVLPRTAPVTTSAASRLLVGGLPKLQVEVRTSSEPETTGSQPSVTTTATVGPTAVPAPFEALAEAPFLSLQVTKTVAP